jgi:integrase
MAIFKKARCKRLDCNYWRVNLESTILDAQGNKVASITCPKCGDKLVQDKSYTIQWYEGTKKKTKTITGANKQVAEGILATKTAPQKLKKHIRVRPDGNIRFDVVADEYLSAEKIELQDPDRAASAIILFKKFFGTKLLSEIDYGSIQDYKTERLSQRKNVRRKEWKVKIWKRNFKIPRPQPEPLPPAKKISRATVGRELSVLNSIFKFAIRKKYLDAEDNPGKDVKVPQSRTIKRVLSKEQRDRLFSELSEQIRSFFLLMAVTGWRYGEVAKLTWADLSKFTSIAHVTDPKNCKVRDDEEPRFLSSAAWAIIEGQAKESTHVFFNPKTKKPWGDLRASFKRAAIRAGLVYSDGSVFRPHDLRHDFASWCGKALLPIQTIMALLGHKDPRSSTRYMHLNNSHLEEACNVMEAKRGLDAAENNKRLPRSVNSGVESSRGRSKPNLRLIK